jgi:hypothetical protein
LSTDPDDDIPDATIGTVKNFAVQSRPRTTPDPWDGITASRALVVPSNLDLAAASPLLGPQVVQSLGAHPGNRWGVKGVGTGVKQGAIDGAFVGEFVTAWVQTVKWVANALYPTRGVAPAIGTVGSHASIVIELAPGLEEEPVPGPDGVDIYPTVEAGQFLSALLSEPIDASPESQQAFEERMRLLRGRAAESYAGFVRVVKAHKMNIDVVTPVRAGAGSGFRREELSLARAELELQVLDNDIEISSRPVEIVGILDRSSWTKTEVDLIGEAPKGDIRATYGDDLRPKLQQFWGKRVTATFLMTGPDELDWRPRARRMKRTYVLQKLELFEGTPPGV